MNAHRQLGLLFCLLVSIGFSILCPGYARADEWVKSPNNGNPTWIDTSHYEPRTRWIDTSHWDVQWGWSWINAGYWSWVADGHNDFYYAYMTCWPPNWWIPGYQIWWEQEADYCCWDWGWYPMRFAYSWGGHYHASGRVCPGYGWSTAWWKWHDKSYWAWVDTSYWSYCPYNVWIASGYWETYQEWIASGYWAPPFQATITVDKNPPFVFTKWHYLTTDGRFHDDGDEPAHMDLKVTFSTNKPIATYRVYADVQRADKARTHYDLMLGSGSFAAPANTGEILARGEYEHAGLATHYIQLTATDGSVGTAYFDVPINGYKSIAIDELHKAGSDEPFQRSLQNMGTITF